MLNSMSYLYIKQLAKVIEYSENLLSDTISTNNPPEGSPSGGRAKGDIPMQEDNKPISEMDTPLSYSPWED